MSHVAKLEVLYKDIEALQRACNRCGAKYCGRGFVKFYDGTEVGGHVIQIPGWQYSICVTGKGELLYDNYNGEWGDIEQLNQLKQVYAIETAKVAAEQQGYTYQEERLPTGVLKLTINI